MKGRVPWNKEKHTGLVPKTAFKKGHKPWTTGKKNCLSEESKRSMIEKKRGIRVSPQTEFKKGSAGHKGKLHSEETRRIISEKNKGRTAWNKGKEWLEMRGEKHFNWKGGVTSLNDYLRTTPKWKVWREAVFKRDDFTCQNPNCKFCNNELGVELQPHHIKPLSLFPEMVFEVNNGITYCASFHLKSGLHKRLNKISYGGD